MREFKNSGVEWIGSIPADWSTLTIGSLFKVRNEKVNDTDYPPLSVSKGGVVPQMENVAKSDANDNRKMVLVNDFVINSRSDRKQSCGVSSMEGSVSLINTVLYLTEESPILPQYLNYLMKNYGFAEEFYRWGHGIVADLWTTRWQEMKSIILPIPSKQEQECILNEINEKTHNVDLLITNVHSQIEKLKSYRQSLITETVTHGLDASVAMKDSHIEWIGNIPQSWKMIRKLSFLTTEGISYGIVKLFDPDDINGIKVLRCSDVLEGTICPDNIRTVTQEVSDEYSRTILSGGEVVVNVRGSLGGCAVVPNEMKGYNIAREVAKITLNDSMHNRYLMYYLLSHCFERYRTIHLSGSVYVGLNIELLSSCPVPCPSMDEQKDIADYLDTQCSQIDNLISIKQQKIDKLNEYKKSLIYEYVTGKKEVQ